MKLQVLPQKPSPFLFHMQQKFSRFSHQKEYTRNAPPALSLLPLPDDFFAFLCQITLYTPSPVPDGTALTPLISPALPCINYFLPKTATISLSQTEKAALLPELLLYAFFGPYISHPPYILYIIIPDFSFQSADIYRNCIIVYKLPVNIPDIL